MRPNCWAGTMTKKKLGKALLLIALITPGFLNAQQVVNIQASQLSDTVVRVTYDLQTELPGQLFDIQLFISANDFALPLIYVEGDVGPDIPGGRNRFIDWNVARELIAFDGDLVFEVRAKLTFSPVQVTNPVSGGVRRGTTQKITWLGSNPENYVDIELFRDDRKIRTISRTSNDGSYQWVVPMDAKPGQGYSIKISSTSSTQFHQGGYFSVKRKIPLAIKLIPLAVAAPLVIILTDDGGSSGPRILPAPPDNPD